MDWGKLFGDMASSAVDTFITGATDNTSTSSKVNRTNTLTKDQRALLSEMTTRALEGIQGNDVAKMPTAHVPATQSETGYSDWINSGFGNQLLSGQPLYGYNPGAVENYYTDYIKNPAMQEYEDITLPGIKEAYAGSGYWGSARANAQAQAGEDLQTNLAQQRAKLYYDELQTSRAEQQAAAERAQIASTSLYQAGQMERDIASEETMESLTRFLSGEEVDGEQAWYYNPNVSMAMSLLGINPYSYNTTMSTSGVSPGQAAMLTGTGVGLQSLIDSLSTGGGSSQPVTYYA